ncbi:MAG: hypothetical protein GWP59_08920, partial [Chlamydiales bacterium]|nr:hypothetical protein [Chlamydiales bacterium]
GTKTFSDLYFEFIYNNILREKHNSLDFTRFTYMKYTGLHDPIQDFILSFCRELAESLIHSSGKIELSLIQKARLKVEESLFYIIPGLEGTKPFMAHIYRVIKSLESSVVLRDKLNSLQKPFLEKKSRELIYRSLNLNIEEALDDRKARVLTLFCMLFLIRQSVGSCFATAPALVIQQEQLEQFISDFSELMSAGRLRKTFEGEDFEVPMSPSSGIGELKRPIYIGSKGTKLWYSPSLLDLLSKVGMISSEGSFILRAKEAKALIKPIIKEFGSYVTAENLLKVLVAKVFNVGITELDGYKDKNERRSTLLPHSVMVIANGGRISKKGFQQGSLEEASAVYEGLKEGFISSVDIPFLKTWEFTLASFAECKPNFCNWNMYHGLGIDSKERGGLGEIIFATLTDTLNEINQGIEQIQVEHEGIYAELQGVEGRLSRASSEDEVRWLKAKYSSVRSEFNMSKEKIENLHHNSQRVSQLFPYLVDRYMELMPKYFQEIYDAEMNDIQANFYDDRPAGFRLLYKHGREQSYLWSLIYSPEEYVDSLTKFFRQVELELAQDAKLAGLDIVIQRIHLAIEEKTQDENFLISSLARMAQAHQGALLTNPLDNLDKLDKKPWAYTSGGSMEDLVMVYYKRSEKPTQVRENIHKAESLFLFVMRELQEVLGSEHFCILMHSPTHAFMLRPDLLSKYIDFKTDPKKELELYKSRCHSFLLSHSLEQEQLPALISFLAKEVKGGAFISSVNLSDTFTWSNLKKEILSQLTQSGLEMNSIEEEIEGAILSAFPLIKVTDVQSLLTDSVAHVAGVNKDLLNDEVNRILSSGFEFLYITYADFIDLCLLTLIQLTKKISAENDLLEELESYLIKEGVAFPKAIVFADTNWSHFYFSFVYSITSQSIELWRSDCNGRKGRPMTSWKKHLKGSKDSVWGVYKKPHEYRLQ